MVFRRRNKRSMKGHLREALWPSSGWRRAVTYLRHRIARLPGTPFSIAAGLACGAAVSFTPFVGLHFVLAALLAWAIGGNILASALGTAAGNPWTFPFIWLWTYRLGNWMLGWQVGAGGVDPLSIQEFLHHPSALFKPVFLPMIVGSLPTAVVVWIIFFWVTRSLVTRYKENRARAMTRRAAQRARQDLRRKEEDG
jgi:uncharacterized protein (DUF2062 family)